MKFLFAVLLCGATVQAQQVTTDVHYGDPAEQRQVLDVYAPAKAKNCPVVFDNVHDLPVLAILSLGDVPVPSYGTGRGLPGTHDPFLSVKRVVWF